MDEPAADVTRAVGTAPLVARCQPSLRALHAQFGRTEAAHGALMRAIEMFRRMEMRYRLPSPERRLAVVGRRGPDHRGR